MKTCLKHFQYIGTQHPDWDPIGDGFPNDVAVIELENPLEFNNKIDKIQLPDSDQGDFDGDKCDISGWGLTQGGRCLPGYINIPVAET